MSRHKLQRANGSAGCAIVGYDRPVGAFFLQIWGEDDDVPEYEDDCYDIDNLENDGVIVPPGLRERLIAEACGKADTNVCKTWR
jgi:hypothetical protein